MVENLAERLGSFEALKERIEELEDYVDIGVLRKQAGKIEQARARVLSRAKCD